MAKKNNDKKNNKKTNNLIWDESVVKQSRAKGIYKLYFEGFEENCYIGKTTASLGFDNRLSQHRTALWKIYHGGSSRLKLETFDIIKQDEYKKMNKSEIANFEKRTDEMWEDFYEGFTEDYIIPGDSKYIKMAYFMRLNNLKLKDLRFKIIKEVDENIDEKELWNMEHDLIKENDCYIKGFNATAIAEFTFSGKGERDDFNSLDRMIEIMKENNTNENDFVKWNCYWNAYQTFKFNFLNNFIGWLIHFGFINNKDFLNYVRNLEASISEIVFNKKNEYKIKNEEKIFNLVSLSKKHNFNFYNKNFDLWVPSNSGLKIKDLIKNKKWSENNIVFLSKVLEKENEKDKGYFETWKKWDDVFNFFVKNPFQNTKSIYRIKNKIEEITKTIKTKKYYFSNNEKWIVWSWNIEEMYKKYPILFDYLKKTIVYKYVFF